MNTWVPKKNVIDKKKICFIAQFPPPVHGLSKAVDTLYNSELALEFDFEKIDITDNKKIIWNLWKIGRSKADLFYFTISQTKGGNLRDIVILKLLELQNKKCLIHLHGGYYRTLVDNDLKAWQRKANYTAVSKLRGAIVLGKSLRWMFEGMLSNDRIYIVPNCVDDEYFMSDIDFKKKMDMLSFKTVKHILYLSNFIRNKGYPEVLQMAKIEKERCKAGEKKKYHFDFAGNFFEKKERKFFFEYIKKYHLYDYITYHGVVIGAKKQELLKNADIFALPTRYPKEGQPISILEAMGNGVVVLTTDHAGIPDLVNEDNGIIYKKGQNMKQIYEMIADFDYKRACEISRIRVKEEFRKVNYIFAFLITILYKKFINLINPISF